MKRILYKQGFKYQLVEDYCAILPFCPLAPIEQKYISFYPTGELCIKRGYAWDGPSGPTIDTKNFLRGSLEHDALYQLMRQELLDQDYRAQADARLVEVCKQDGMSWLRAQWVFLGVRAGGAPSADPTSAKLILEAP